MRFSIKLIFLKEGIHTKLNKQYEDTDYKCDVRDYTAIFFITIHFYDIPNKMLLIQNCHGKLINYYKHTFSIQCYYEHIAKSKNFLLILLVISFLQIVFYQRKYVQLGRSVFLPLQTVRSTHLQILKPLMLLVS